VNHANTLNESYNINAFDTYIPSFNFPSACGFSKADIVFLTDASESLSEENFVKMMKFMTDIVSSVDDSDTVRIGSVTYNHFTYINFYLDQFKTVRSVIITFITLNLQNISGIDFKYTFCYVYKRHMLMVYVLFNIEF
jgi:hypothetical protein